MERSSPKSPPSSARATCRGSGSIALTTFDDGGGVALYAGGDFTAAGGAAARRIAKWDGSTWSALGSGLTAIGSGAASLTKVCYHDIFWLEAYHRGGYEVPARMAEALRSICEEDQRLSDAEECLTDLMERIDEARPILAEYGARSATEATPGGQP